MCFQLFDLILPVSSRYSPLSTDMKAIDLILPRVLILFNVYRSSSCTIRLFQNPFSSSVYVVPLLYLNQAIQIRRPDSFRLIDQSPISHAGHSPLPPHLHHHHRPVRKHTGMHAAVERHLKNSQSSNSKYSEGHTQTEKEKESERRERRSSRGGRSLHTIL